MSAFLFCIREIYFLLRLIFNGCISLIFAVVHARRPTDPLQSPTEPLVWESATALASAIRSKKVTAEEVILAYTKRIAEVNKALNCVVDARYMDAIAEAQKIDSLLASKTEDDIEDLAQTKPLLGVPFTIKESATVKGLHHTCGLKCRADVIAKENAVVVDLLRAAGAVPLAVTNVSELSMWYECSNHMYGRTNNPYDLARTPGGSSGGEAALQAACGIPFGIGTDIGGSIRIPAFFCGVFGYKPTPGLIPIIGCGPHDIQNPDAPRMLSVGPIARFFSDVLLVSKVLLGPENVSRLGLDVSRIDFSLVKFLYTEDDCSSAFVNFACSSVKADIHRAMGYFEKVYGSDVRQVHLKKASRTLQMWMQRLKADKTGPCFSEELTNRQRRLNVTVEFFKRLVGRSSHTLAALGFAAMEQFAATLPRCNNSDAAFSANERVAFKEEMTALLGTDCVLVCPAFPTPALYHNAALLRPFDFAYAAICNLLDLPAVQVPLGTDTDGLPRGVHVAAAPGNDSLALHVAKELEKAFGGWMPPFETRSKAQSREKP